MFNVRHRRLIGYFWTMNVWYESGYRVPSARAQTEFENPDSFGFGKWQFESWSILIYFHRGYIVCTIRSCNHFNRLFFIEDLRERRKGWWSCFSYWLSALEDAQSTQRFSYKINQSGFISKCRRSLIIPQLAMSTMFNLYLTITTVLFAKDAKICSSSRKWCAHAQICLCESLPTSQLWSLVLLNYLAIFLPHRFGPYVRQQFTGNWSILIKVNGVGLTVFQTWCAPEACWLTKSRL